MTTNVNPFQPTATTATSAAGGNLTGGQALGKEEFLRMLVTQLSNQDPMNPMDGQEFAAQLAQFTSVEQLINIGETLATGTQANNALARSLNNSIATGLIGKTVEVSGNSVAWDGAQVADMGFDLPSSASSVEVVIRDANGHAVRTVQLGAQDLGAHDFSWDGKTDGGASAASGTYTFEINATDDAGNALTPETYVRGEVDRITLGAEGTSLWIGTLSLSMGHVRSIAGN